MELWAREAAERRQLYGARSVASLQPKTGKTRRAHSAAVSGYHRVIKKRLDWLRLSGDLKHKTTKNQMISLEIDDSIDVFRYL